MPCPLLSLLEPSPLPPPGSCSHSSLAPLMKFCSRPYSRLPLQLAFVLHGWHSIPFTHGRRSVFQALCEVPFRPSYVVLWGNYSVSNFTASSSFRIRNSIGHSHSSRSSQVFGLVLPSSTSLIFLLLLSFGYTTPPSGHLTAPFPG